MFKFIEEYLDYYVTNIGVKDKNKQILESINKQVYKGMPLTDRQFVLIKTILLEQFPNMSQDIEPKLGIRHIDRRKYVKLVDTDDVFQDSIYESYKSSWKWIAVRFPFSKKDIIKIQSIVHKTKEYFHTKGSHEHFFRLTESNLFQLVTVFKDSNFEIEKQIIEMYNEVCYIKENKELFLSCYKNKKFYNLNNDSKKLIHQELGHDFTDLQILDRKRRYAIDYIEQNTFSTLAGSIASRKTPTCLVDSNIHSINTVAESILHLNRFPVLVVIDENNEYDQVYKAYNAFKYFISDEKQSVLFRVENTESTENLNTFVKDNNLNNWVDLETEIVYIKKNKLPKLLLRSEWTPMCILCLSSLPITRHVKKYITNSDLLIYFDTDLPLYERYQRWPN